MVVNKKTDLSSLTNAGMPLDLKIARRPWRWWDKLWSTPAAHFVVSRSLEEVMARTNAATIWGEFIIACRDASFFDNWWTIMAAWLTTTWSSSFRSLTSSGIARVAKSASSWNGKKKSLNSMKCSHRKSWTMCAIQIYHMCE